jgi:uncharacterized membrane protein YoaK (UPF0700 family)
MCLAIVAGYVDAYALLKLQVYASFMSGNTTQGGLLAGQGQLLEAGYRLLPIPFFVVGVAFSTLLLQGRRRWNVRRLWTTAAGLLIVSVVWTWLEPRMYWFDVILLSFAMGVVNSSITDVGGETVSVGYVTGDLFKVGQYLGLACAAGEGQEGEGRRKAYTQRVAILIFIWAAFLAGAILGALGMLLLSTCGLMAPAAILCALILYDLFRADQGHGFASE